MLLTPSRSEARGIFLSPGPASSWSALAWLSLTGDYPPWWKGNWFTRPIEAWVAGSTAQTTRDIVQAELLDKLGPGTDTNPGGPIGLGTGMIPLSHIRKVQRRSGGVPDAVDQVFVQHVSGGTSVLGFKSYAQGRKALHRSTSSGWTKSVRWTCIWNASPG